jgi:hypothetical protein
MKQLLTAFLIIISPSLHAQKTTGNPVIRGWYADPEAAVFNKTFWIYPTYSAPYEQQVFLDAFLPPTWQAGKSMSALSIRLPSNGRVRPSGRLPLFKRIRFIIYSSAPMMCIPAKPAALA